MESLAARTSARSAAAAADRTAAGDTDPEVSLYDLEGWISARSAVHRATAGDVEPGVLSEGFSGV